MGADKDEFLSMLVPQRTKLYNFILKSANYSTDADDLYQETILKAYQYFASYDREKAFGPWIFRIACNVIRDFFRKQRPVFRIDSFDIPDRTDARTKEDIREIYRIAGKLKPKQRQVFFLYYYNNFKISEISDITGLSSFNVKFILNQSRNALKRHLEGQG